MCCMLSISPAQFTLYDLVYRHEQLFWQLRMHPNWKPRIFSYLRNWTKQFFHFDVCLVYVFPSNTTLVIVRIWYQFDSIGSIINEKKWIRWYFSNSAMSWPKWRCFPISIQHILLLHVFTYAMIYLPVWYMISLNVIIIQTFCFHRSSCFLT